MSIKRKILVAVSGGRTSGMLAYLIKLKFAESCDVAFVFANTSREHPKTYEFVNSLDRYFNLGINWIESLVHHGQRRSCTFTLTNYEDAKTDGSVYREVIKKYGIPNKKFPHCTRELKTNPMRAFAKEHLGWIDYEVAIGYRADEPKRINWDKAEKANPRQWYLLAELGVTKKDVALFWRNQSFDLGLADYEGNCRLCFKKSKRKILTQLISDPESAIWIESIEREFGNYIPASRDKAAEGSITFFREGDSIKELIEESRLPFDPAIDTGLDINGADLSAFNAYLDEEEECAGSCEPFSHD